MLPQKEVFDLAKMVPYQKGQVHHVVLAQGDSSKIFLISIEEAKLDTHKAPLNALLYVLHGTGTLTYEGVDYELKEGDSFVFTQGALHSLATRHHMKFVLFLTSDQL